MIQAKGSAASEPQLPGAQGSNPLPNQVASSAAGCEDGNPVLCMAPKTAGATSPPPARRCLRRAQ